VRTYQLYGSQDHSFDAVARYKFSRLTAMLGYSIARNTGNFTVYNLLQPLGALDSSFHRPVASLEVALTKTVSAKAAWNYYGYNEQGVTGPPTLPRDFHANSATMSLKYAF
jgi:hypothetical protein